MNAMTSSDMQCRQAVLGIEIGDTAAHAIFAWRDGEKTRVAPVRCLGETPDFAFSTDIFPFDDNPLKYIPVCFLNRKKANRKVIPAKFVAHVLLDKIDTMQTQNPVGIGLKMERCKDDFNEAIFKAVLQDAFKQLLRFILMSAKETLNMHKPDNLKLKTVAIAIPSQWDVSFRNLYVRLLREVFAEISDEMISVAVRYIDVVFHSTATAISQYFLHAISDARGFSLRKEGIIPDIDTIGSNINTQLFINCGGHYADSILTTIQRDESGKRVLCEGGQSQGAEGGAEWWASFLVWDILYKTLAPLDEHTTPDHEVMQSLIDNKLSFPAKPDDHSFVRLPSGSGLALSIDGFTKDQSKTAFHRGFQHVTRMVWTQLQRLSSMKNARGTKEHTVTIFLAGGSTGQAEVEFTEWMEGSCARLKLPKAINLRDMATFRGGAQVATGAAYATLVQQARGNTGPEPPRPRSPAPGPMEALQNEMLILDLDGIPSSSPEATPVARADDAADLPPIDNVFSLGEVFSLGQTASASNAAEAEVESRKRKASVEPDDFIPTKSFRTVCGLSIRTKPPTSKDASSTGNETSYTGKDGSST